MSRQGLTELEEEEPREFVYVEDQTGRGKLSREASREQDLQEASAEYQNQPQPYLTLEDECAVDAARIQIAAALGLVNHLAVSPSDEENFRNKLGQRHPAGCDIMFRGSMLSPDRSGMITAAWL